MSGAGHHLISCRDMHRGATAGMIALALGDHKAAVRAPISMDWVATLLAAARAEAVRTYPLDGINLPPGLT